MNDTVGRVFMYYFGILIMFLLPVIVLLVNMDTAIESYINKTVSDFVDESRSTGMISPENYQDMVNKLARTGTSYEVTMIHRSKASVPDSENGYINTYRVYGREEILEYMDNQSGSALCDYVMKDGDFFQVQVKSLAPSTGSNLFGRLLGGRAGVKYLASYGGYVGNTKR